jgi:hypothetical protein
MSVYWHLAVGPEISYSLKVLGSPSRTLLRFLGSVAVLPPIIAAPMVASLRLAELQVRLVSG